MSHGVVRRVATIATLTVLVFGGLPVWAQQTQQTKGRPPSKPPGWEIEIHGGATLGGNVHGGTGLLPGPGQPFTTFSKLPSRRVSSWYFGDGTALLNEVATAFEAPRVVALDPILARALAQTGTGGSFGVRVARRLATRVRAEFNFDYSIAPVKLTDDARSAVETSRRTFADSLNGLIGSGPFTNLSVSSIADIRDTQPRQIFTSAALDIDVVRAGKTAAYATVGAGHAKLVGDPPAVGLHGTYEFLIAGVYPVKETDAVVVRSAGRGRFVTVIGGGFRHDLSDTRGVRVDIRTHIGRSSDTVLDATPVVATLLPADMVASEPPPNSSIQFSNNPSTGHASSLSGPAINGLATFRNGRQMTVSVSAGFFWRF